MQPEPPAIQSNADSTEHQAQADLALQHGRHIDHVSSDALQDSGSPGSEISASVEQNLLDETPSRQPQESRPSPGGAVWGLSPRNTPSPPARNRIAEYEQASTPPVRRREGPVFEVIKRSRGPNDKRSPIQDLPNGPYKSCLFVFAHTKHAQRS